MAYQKQIKIKYLPPDEDDRQMDEEPP